MFIDRKVFDKYPEIMTTQQVAEILGIHPATVTILARDPINGIKGFRTGLKQKSPFRFFKTAVIDYIKAREFKPYAAVL